LLVLDRPHNLSETIWQLLRIGYDLPLGWLAGGMQSWRGSGLPLASMPQMDVHELRERLEAGDVDVLDVRQPAEWGAGHIDGATFITAAQLPVRYPEVEGDRPLAVVCGGGYRSSVASSLLASVGRRNVFNVPGGMKAWTNSGYPTVK
jgi:hydroxyacylglutathione hydrolase